jgi:hypothetical protein
MLGKEGGKLSADGDGSAVVLEAVGKGSSRLLMMASSSAESLWRVLIIGAPQARQESPSLGTPSNEDCTHLQAGQIIWGMAARFWLLAAGLLRWKSRAVFRT